MKKPLLLATLALCSYNLFSQINVQWESRYTSAGASPDKVSDMYVDAAGNVYVTGASNNGATGFDMVTVKYNNAGSQQWVATYNGVGNSLDEPRGIAVDASGNVFVVGYTNVSGTNYDFITVKYNSAGAQQWAMTNGTAFFDEGRAIAIDNNGDVIVTGATQSATNNTNYRTIKYNGVSGALTWFQDFTSTGNNIDIAIDVAVDASNNVYITGQSFNTGQNLNVRTIKYNSAGTQQYNTQYNHNNTLNSNDIPYEIVVDASGVAYVAATVFNGTAGDDDILLIKYSAAGAVTNTALINGTASDIDKPNSLIIDASQTNVYFTGRTKSTSGAEDFITAKYNSSLTQVWLDKFNGSGNNYDEGYDLILDGTNTFLYVTGYSNLSTSNNDYLTIKYNAATGSRVWATRFNGPANNADEAKKINVDATGNVYVSGNSRGATSNVDYSTIKYCQHTTTATVDDDTICVGTTVNFNVSGGSSISWSPSTFLSCTNCATPTAVPTSDICYYVSTTSGSGCIDYDTVCVVVNPLPGPVITPSGPTTFCQGGSVTLTASGYAAYSWNVGPTTSAITVSTSGTYSVTVTDAMGCQNFTEEIVTVNPNPTVNAGIDTALCYNDSIQLLATGASTYAWQPDPALSATNVANPYVHPAATDSYIVTGTDGNGCTDSDTVMVTVKPLPAAPDLIYVASSNFLLVTNYSTGIQWYQNGIMSPGVTVQSVELDDTLGPYPCGDDYDYFVIVTGANGCISPSSDTIYVDSIYNAQGICWDTTTVDTTGIVSEAYARMNTKVYPNPSSNVFYLEFNDMRDVNLFGTITDGLGREIYSIDRELLTGYRKIKIDLSDQAPGIYLVNLNIDDVHWSYKLIKQ